MRNLSVFLVFVTISCLAENCHAAVVLSISPSTGANSLANNSSLQTIDLFAYSDGGSAVDVLGMSLELTIGTGTAGVWSSPSGITMTGISSIWDTPGFNPDIVDTLDPGETDGLAVVNDATLANTAVLSGDALNPSLVGRLNIDTTGIEDTSGVITVVGGGVSFFIDSSLSSISTAPFSAQFDIGAGAAAVPEPSTWAMLGLGLGGFGLWRRRQQKTAEVIA